MKKRGCPPGQIRFNGKCAPVLYRANIPNIYGYGIVGNGRTVDEALRACKKKLDTAAKSRMKSYPLPDYASSIIPAWDYFSGSVEKIIAGHGYHEGLGEYVGDNEVEKELVRISKKMGRRGDK